MTTSKNFSKIKPFTIALFAVLCSSTGEGKEVLLLSTDEAIRLAFLNNRDLQITEPGVEEAESRLLLSGRLPNPEVEVSAKGDSFGNDENEGNFEVAVRQSFPLSSRLRRERELRKRQVTTAEAELARHRWKLAAKVERTVIGLAAANQRTKGQRAVMGVNAEIVSFLREQVKRGEASSLDLAQAELTGLAMEQKAAELATKEKNKTLALKQLLGMEADEVLSIDRKLQIPEEEPNKQIPLEAIVRRRSDLALARARVDEADAALNLEKSNRFPDVEVNFFVERERSSYPAAGLDRNTLAGLGFSIPIPFRQRNADDMEQARFDRIEAEATSEALRFRVRNEYAQAFRARLDAWRLAREASGEILQLAAKNVADFQAAYRQGQASLLQTQRVQEQLLELKNAALEAIVNYHLAKARMREVVGDYPKTKPILKQVSPRK